MNPYILMPQPMQDVSGLQPVFQNTGQQQANQQAALAQQNQLVNQAGQPQSNAGVNQLALAMMLRKKDPNQQSLAGKMGTYAKSIPAIIVGLTDKRSKKHMPSLTSMVARPSSLRAGCPWCAPLRRLWRVYLV
jgi:hypothetical protein